MKFLGWRNAAYEVSRAVRTTTWQGKENDANIILRTLKAVTACSFIGHFFH